MGRRKRVVKIPKAVIIKCPFCGENTRFNVPQEGAIQEIECNKCNIKITTPATRCCIICAFSNKKCPYSSIMEAKVKGLEIR